MRLCFATNNKNKVKEIDSLLTKHFALLSLDDIGCEVELPETRNTLEGNSLQKAEYVYQHFGINCFADDTGLEVDALNGAPGVFSARFAGPEKDSRRNMALLLEQLKNTDNRVAQFRTVITLILEGNIKQFEGIVKGKIAADHQGTAGFGYDPIFIPQGYDKTFAEMDITEKNKISHRASAIRQLVQFLNDVKHSL